MKSDNSPAYRQPWIYSAFVDSVFILSPVFLSVVAVVALRGVVDVANGMPLWVWVVFILFMDVAHVYATLYRTYFDKAEFEKHQALFTTVPLLVWVIGALLYSMDGLLFWRVLAYVAVFHFIRQQYGFMRVYARKEDDNRFRFIDQVFIYSCTIYPIVYWHTHLPRNFHWFVEGDFVAGLPGLFENIALFCFVFAGAAYLLKEIKIFLEYQYVNIPKTVFVIGTALSWNTGIVLFDEDVVFTVTNVVSHAIPYMALVWIYGKKRSDRDVSLISVSDFRLGAIFHLRWIPVYLLSLFLFAFIEEGFWNGFVWREHLRFFKIFSFLPKVEDNATLAWLVSLLSLPQTTHYVLDGFIWRLSEEKSEWKNIIFQRWGCKS